MKKILSFFSGFSVLFISTLVFAQDAAAASSNAGTIAIGAALAIGLAAIGGTFAQGKAAAAALEGIARNPGAASKVQTPMILGLALIESLVLASWAIAYLLLSKI